MKNKYLIVSLLFIIATLFSLVIYNQAKVVKQAYVENTTLFDKFAMKIELEKKYKNIENIKKNILDSIYNEIKLKVRIQGQANSEEVDNLKKEYLFKKQNFENENAEISREYNEQIWNQLNEYTKQYAIEKKYDFIFGANGQGGLMYSGEAYNVTNELIEFVNAKYNGGHK